MARMRRDGSGVVKVLGEGRTITAGGARVVTCIRGAGGGAAAAAVGGEGPGGTGETGEAGEAGGACVGSARREAEARLDGLPG